MYDARLLYVGELQKMGADIGVLAQTAVIKGPCALRGTQVRALDIRSGAAVILATLVAEGTSEISGVGLVDRGYDGIDIKLAALGAKIQRVA